MLGSVVNYMLLYTYKTISSFFMLYIFLHENGSLLLFIIKSLYIFLQISREACYRDNIIM